MPGPSSSTPIREFTLDRSIFGEPLVRYACPQCLIALKSPLRDAGSEDACPECERRFIVPGRAEWETERQRQQEHDRRRTKRRHQRRQSTWRDWLKRWLAVRTAAARKREPRYLVLTFAGHSMVATSVLCVAAALAGGIVSLLTGWGMIPAIAWLMLLALALPPFVLAHVVYAFRDLVRNSWHVRIELDRSAGQSNTGARAAPGGSVRNDASKLMDDEVPEDRSSSQSG